MDEMKMNTPLNEKDLNMVSGGADGETTQVRIGSGDGSRMYCCPYCGCMDFYVIGSNPGSVLLRCKSCGQQSTCSQN